MPSYALYRLPHADCYTLMEQTGGEAECLSSYAELNGRSGFALAPFAVSSDCPVLLIRPDRVERIALGTVPPERLTAAAPAGGGGTPVCANALTSSGRTTYASDFADFHARLLAGEYSKIVLARSADIETSEDISAEELFVRACMMYPRMFVALVSTPQSGTWLAATPEILLENDKDDSGGGLAECDGRCGRLWRTIALAGTMRLEGGMLGFDNPPLRGTDDTSAGIFWSTKDIQEQRYVATYIAECLKPFATDCREEGPRTVRAGNLVHLRSDFTFALADTSRTGDLLEALHPTPAVCGLPKAGTWRHIIEQEHTVRRYYSGFMGPLSHNGATHLYVSLRCMQIADGRHYRLYAGGGLLKDSDEEQEWRETEAKMETMKEILMA